MSRIFSFRDLRLIPEIGEFNEIELLHPKHDDLVNHYLFMLGFNLMSPVLYVPAKHRDLRNHVAVGFRAVGSLSRGRAFLNSKLCTTTERLIAASKQDMSLTVELAKLMGNSCSLGNPYESESLFAEQQFPSEMVESDYDDVKAEILSLEKIRDMIRGSPYNEYGGLKTPDEYQQ